MKKPLEIKETNMFLPLSVFKDRKLTILESIIVYLREKGLRYSEIAELVNRDQRNIWTIYSKTIKKQRKILK
jgi:transcriptional regulator